jgi:hypothetical protein
MLLLTAAFGLLLANTSPPRWAKAGLVLGLGAVLHTIWEIVEFWLDELLDAALDVAAMTTIIDFMVGLLGSAIGAAITFVWAWRRIDLGGRLLGRTEPGPSPS